MTEFEYRIDEIIEITKIHLRLLATPLRARMNYKAGQYLLVRYPSGQYFPFSLANTPTGNKQIELHMRKDPTDVETNAFLQEATHTNRIFIKGPFGSGYQKKSKTLLLLAAGTGFAPAKAIIEEIVLHNMDTACHLYWSVRKPEDFYLAELPQIWQRILPLFKYTPVCTKSVNNTAKNNILSSVSKDFSTFAHCQMYVFGPPALASDALKLFSKQGLDKNNFFTDVLSTTEIENIFELNDCNHD